MSNEIRKEEWSDYFKEFNERNQMRPTKLEIFGILGAQQEEKHLPLLGIDVEMKGTDTPKIEIMLGNKNDKGTHLTHTVTRANRVLNKLGTDGREDVLEIENEESKTLLQFETLLELKGAA